MKRRIRILGSWVIAILLLLVAMNIAGHILQLVTGTHP